MADINQVITLGIGTPGDISFFIRFGLGPKVIQYDLWAWDANVKTVQALEMDARTVHEVNVRARTVKTINLER